ncbi:Na+/H+ antiporter NhaC family protein [Crassaminicella profunda]|uniref:Na+/H+ antiporter NhaC family protein n=1 Tax=Crassaminicella profunda TaxID=1286698 RepID=UPI001CA6DB5F|nr:Na+/H+ antiporter NhaC family protein [Crassaminicella profunda]QZY54019.1 Na+/H+ antiporter NhaC family protein [Crassaminicella profunda]
MRLRANKTWRKTIIIGMIILLSFATSCVFASGGEGESIDFGIFSLLPPLVAIVLAIVTKEVIPSLFIGTWVAGTMLAGGNPITGFGNSVESLWNALGDPWSARIVLTSLTLGGLVGIMRVGGGIEAVVNWITKKIKSAKGALLATELAGFVIFFEDYVNTLVVGTTMSPITKEYKISKEKLSYIVDSTAAPIACIAGISSWVAYLVGQIGMQFDDLGIKFSPYAAYLKSIPFVLYSFVALALLTYVVLSGKDFGPMLEAEKRARTTGKIVRDGAKPLIAAEQKELEPDKDCPKRLINFIIPIVSLIGFIVMILMKSGGWPEVSISEAIANGSSSKALCLGSFSAVFVTLVLYKIQNLVPTNRLFKGYMEGMRSIFFGTLILIFAWGIGSSIKAVGTAKFLVGITEGVLSPAIIPLITFLIGGIISFSTGTSYGTVAVLMPIVIPIVFNVSTTGGIDPMTYIFPTIGAVFAGAIFGDHCSPISDTTIMSSMFSGADHIDHVKTQMPYALLAGLGAVIGYIGVAIGLNIVLNILIGMLVVLGVFKVISKPIE